MKQPDPRDERTLVILQSNYIPWKGYFDLMNAADLFVVFDEVQYTRRDWRNRNKIVIDGAAKWLSIPVQTKGKYDASIAEIEVSDNAWAANHWNSIRLAYGKAPFFDVYRDGLEDTYVSAGALSHLSAINRLFLEHLAPMLGIDTEIAESRAVARTTHDPAARLVEICQAFGATCYLSGPAAKSYIDPDLFDAAGIRLEYADYEGYPSYAQNSETFEHGVSVIDLLMHTGDDARSHLKSTHPCGLFERPRPSDSGSA